MIHMHNANEDEQHASKRRGVTIPSKKSKVQHRRVHVQEANMPNPELSIIRLLQHRIAPGGFLNLVERLDHEQWSAIREIGFGGMLAVRTRLIPKRLARWLLENYDPWETSLKLPNGKVLIYEEDVHATLGLPMGPLDVREGKTLENDIEYAIFLEQWRQRWNIERGRPPVGSKEYAIIERGGHGVEFVLDFIIYAISTYITGNANGTCHFCVLNNLRIVNEILQYNWCAYVIKCLNDAIIEWKVDKTKFFTSPLLFLMVSTFYHLIVLMCTQRLNKLVQMEIMNHNICDFLFFQLFYLDRVEFKAEKVERGFPTAINWPTYKVKKREGDEQLTGEYGRGRIIERLDYKNIKCLAHVDLQQNLKELNGEHNKDYLLS
ncbi:hypothetical protein Cgig2_028058 [Carnegiea gigantea]|uniref:Uncharacterized protein n=1 Tax=Carnegiea gigantea TaxID=171969 RepID=A0A9Q1GKL4_9CARY|nr:hypothetical protein Cgig2_028058 [Carnegiea gigantea]